MRKKIDRILYKLDDKLRVLCGRMSPEKRLLFIAIVLLILTVVNIYFMFSAIYNMGKRDAEREQYKIENINGLDIEYEQKNHWERDEEDFN